MTTRDDPTRTAGIGEHWMDEVPGWTDLDDAQEAAYEEARDAGMFDPDEPCMSCTTCVDDGYPDQCPHKGLAVAHVAGGEYDGNLVDDCRSVDDLGKQLEAIRAMPPGENFFARVRRLNAEEKEALLKLYERKTA